MQIINQTKNTILADQAELCQTFLKRIIGLLNRKELKKGEALLIKPCNSIHTLFMRFPIDVVFLDRKNRVIKILPYLKPWRLSGIYLSAGLCLELPAGTIESSHTSIGDILSFVN